MLKTKTQVYRVRTKLMLVTSMEFQLNVINRHAVETLFRILRQAKIGID